MAYQSWSVVFGEQPSAAKWNILGTNDASFNDGTGIANNAITANHILAGAITSPKLAPTVFHNNDGYSMQANSVETVKLTLSIPSQAVGSIVLLMACCTADLGNGAPTLNVETKIRRTNASGTIIVTSQDTKAAASGATERRTWPLIGIDSLAASTARDYVLTDASNLGAGVTSNFMAIVMNDDGATFA